MKDNKKGIFLDTSFWIRLLDKNDPLFANAKAYFKYFIESDFELFLSTIVIAEYCTGGDINQLPLKNLQILPFNLDHAKRTSEFAKIAFQYRKEGTLTIERKIIPNDTKLFAQADYQKNVGYYLSADIKSYQLYQSIK